MDPTMLRLAELLVGLRMPYWDTILPEEQRLHLRSRTPEELRELRQLGDAAYGPPLSGQDRERALSEAAILLQSVSPRDPGVAEVEPLAACSSAGHEVLVAILLERGFRREMNQALCEASRYGHPAVVKLLLSAGASLAFVDNAGRSALANAAMRGDGRGMEVAEQILRFAKGAPDFELVVRSAIPFAGGPMRRDTLRLLRTAVGTDVLKQRPRAKALRAAKRDDGVTDIRDTRGWLLTAYRLSPKLVVDAVTTEYNVAGNTVKQVDALKKGVWVADRNLFVMRLRGEPWTLLIENLHDLDREEQRRARQRAELITQANGGRALVFGGNHNHEDISIVESGRLVQDSERDLQPNGTDPAPGEGLRVPAVACDSKGDALQLVLGGDLTPRDIELLTAIEVFDAESVTAASA